MSETPEQDISLDNVIVTLRDVNPDKSATIDVVTKLSYLTVEVSAKGKIKLTDQKTGLQWTLTEEAKDENQPRRCNPIQSLPATVLREKVQPS